MMMEMVLILVMMVMERPPLTPRRRGGEDGGDFPLLRGSGAAGSDSSGMEGGRGFAAAATSINFRKNRATLFWRYEGVVKRGGQNGARGVNG
jgi:hypothetical protein